MHRQASSLTVSIPRNQLFLDGNRRAAHASLKVFLAINRFSTDAGHLNSDRQLVAVAEPTDSLDEATQQYSAWLRKRLALCG